MNIIIGSARIDEHNNVTGGYAGDQKQTSKPDYKGEVSMQTFYVHKKGWYVIRFKSVEYATKFAKSMKRACNNPNIGYDQGGRYGIIQNGTKSEKKTECDCSSLVRQCFIEATGKDPGDFTTANAVEKLEATGLVEKHKTYENGLKLYIGDILCTKTKGHIAGVTDGYERSDATIKNDKTNAIYFKTTTRVHIRKDAGVENKSLGVVPNGQKVLSLNKYKTVKNVKWEYVFTTLGGKKIYGYMCSKYLKKI